jgi:hypothetical protein
MLRTATRKNHSSEGSWRWRKGSNARGQVGSRGSRTGSGDSSGWEVTPLGKIVFIALGPALVLLAVHLWLGPSHRTRTSAPAAPSLSRVQPVAPVARPRHHGEANDRTLAPIVGVPVVLTQAGPTPHLHAATQPTKAALATDPAQKPKHQTTVASQLPHKPKNPAPTPAPTPPTNSAPTPAVLSVATPTSKAAAPPPVTHRAAAPRSLRHPVLINIHRAQRPRRLRHQPMPPARAPRPTAPPGSTTPQSTPRLPAPANQPPATASASGSGYTTTPPSLTSPPSKPGTQTKRVAKH